MVRDIERRLIKKSPAARMQREVKKLMEIEGLWDDELIRDIPRSWEKYGDLLLFNGEKYFRNACWTRVQNLLWQCICDVMKVKRIALRHYIIKDTFRSPNVNLVFGNDPWVEFKDNGIIYTWNVQYNMFCAGNAPERHRISTLLCEDEVVVDMYAGIGYFTLPFLLKAKAKIVHACEWNPNAVKALRLNLDKNNVVERCIIHEGDNREVCPQQIADRVNLGLLPSSESGWETACKALNPVSGGILHVHENVTSGINHVEGKNYIDRMVLCKACQAIILKCEPEEENMNRFFDLGCQSSFIIHYDTLFLTDKITIKWKQVEWKIWVLHVCHTLCNILSSINNSKVWKTEVSNLHHVKSYAPHIDHLVLDVKCIPSE